MKKILFCLMILVSTMASAQEGTEMNLWPEGPHTGNGDPQDMAKVTVFLCHRLLSRWWLPASGHAT